ncbi:MAG: hypothetical protein H7Y36_09530 [Armatimonadetes bacterium]|nr:hypothetical protein [Akkermansiaceae bacterium]
MIRLLIFISAALILGLGFLGRVQMDKDSAMAFLLGSLTLGGGLLICGLFTIKMLWHGVIGAGFLALLGLSRSILNFPGIAKFMSGKSDNGNAPLFELAVTLICAFLLIQIFRAWQQERIRRSLG